MAGNRPGDWHVLDLDRDPTPGDPDRVRQLSKNLHDFADDVSDALRLIKGMADEDAVLQWAGKSAKAFQGEFSGVPKQLKKLKKSYEMAGDALADYWPRLERAQALADKALAKGREAQADLTSAKSRLSSADSWVTRAGKEADKYKDDPTGSKDAEKPDEAKVRAATRDAQHAKAAQTSARSDVTDANSALDAAKKMAADARKMREEAARDAKSKIDEASDAGIHNRKWWEEVGDWFSDNWDTIVTVCKVVVAVVGIIAMIIGGPILGAIVLIAALVVLADTLNKYAKGQASLWDVAFAALDCIPGGKGLTTLGGLAKGLKGLKAFGKTGLKGMAMSLRGLGPRMKNLGRQMQKLVTRGDPIDMATGQMVMSATDVGLDGMLPLLFERHHRTGVHSGRLLGPGWTSTFDQRLLLDPTGVRLVVDDGMMLTYPVPEPDVPVMPVQGPNWPLGWEDGELTVHRPETGRTLRFRPVPGRPPSELVLGLVTDRNGNTVSVSYGPDGTPTEIVHHGGHHVGVTCEDGRIVELTLNSHPERPTLIQYGYDGRGDLTRVFNSSGLPLEFGYDDRRRMTSWKDRNGFLYRFTYDEAGRCVAGHGDDGILDYRFAYDEVARRTTAVDSLGGATVYQFNEAYQLIAETDSLGRTTVQEWNHGDQLVARTDPSGRTLRLEWDEEGNLVAVRLPDGSASTAVFNELNLPVELTGYDGAVTRQGWDERGNCVSVTDPSGATAVFTHDGTGALTSLRDPLGAVRRFVNNASGQPVSATDPLGAETRVAYDAFGRPVTLTDPLGSTTSFAWTVEGHQASRTDPDGGTESWTYDGEGNCLTNTDVLGRETRYTYGGFDLVKTRTTPEGVRHTFTHDTELRLTRVTDPRGLTWDYVYDAAGDLTSETDFDGRTLRYVHDSAGQLLSITNPLGQKTEYAYDLVGNLTEKTVDGRSTVFRHDANGRLLQAVGSDVTLAFAYDPTGRVTVQEADGRALTTAYDALGRPVGRTTPTGATASYTYDAAGNRTLLSTSGRRLASAYDPLGREITRRLGDRGLTLTQTWDTDDRLTGRTLDVGGRRLKRDAYTYRADGSVTALEDSVRGRRSLDVDGAGRVTGVRAADWTESYAYDEVGNQTRAVWPDGLPVPDARGDRAYDGNRVSRAGSVHYEYDTAGRVVVRRRTRLSRKPAVWRYTWDAEDCLTSVITPDGTVWRYLYDPMGRRTAKQRLGPDGSTVMEETLFTWDGPHLVEQTTRTAGGVEEVTLTWDRDGIRPLAQTERRTAPDDPRRGVDERFHAIVTDLVGTPTELVSEDGVVDWHATTTLWGLTTWGEDVGTTTPLRFPGQYDDPETELHYNYFRYYDPATATYLSPDPLGMDSGPNPRGYVLDPLLWTDYLGLLTCRQNARRLRRNMRREGRPVSRGQAAAHIVPSGGAAGHWVPGARSRALLERYGVDVNDAANGIPLGHPSPHNFTHREPFLQRVNQRLDQLVQDRTARGFGVRAIRTELRRELRAIGREVEGELSTGVPSPTAVWTGP
jgi:RHS repeat-associated protein